MTENKLSKETSPYLLQHAHNPVHWQAWNQESLDLAQTLNRPIILSIGYSACHWCHVMERESFENESIAAIMNKYFVCIKVDREERPDVDNTYMDALHSMGLRGGWPLNVFLMPNLRPFYGGTYFKPSQWAHICQSIATAFETQFDELAKSADGFAESLRESEIEKYKLAEIEMDKKLNFNTLQNALLSNLDPIWGGIDKAPKFPMPCIWDFLIESRSLASSSTLEKIDKALLLLLQKMACGGIYDQLGGGFARYSVDERWFCPHFEKMLYDNGQLLTLYAKAYRHYGGELFADCLKETITWLKESMHSPDGLFYAAQDADSEGVEGKYYTWHKAEIVELLGEKAEDFCKAYQVTEHGNWEEENCNILWKEHDFRNNIYEKEIAVLKKARDARIAPGLDNKILVGWNALIIKGLCDASQSLDSAGILLLAQNTAHSLLKQHYRNNKLYRTGYIEAFLEDYAALVEACIALYRADFNENHLAWAETLCLEAIDKFFDEKEQFFFFSPKNSSSIANKKELFDNVIPASNSIMAHNLWDLGLLLSRTDFSELAQSMFAKMTKLLEHNVDYLCNWARLGLKIQQTKVEIVCSGPAAIDNARLMKQHLKYERFYILANAGSSSLPLFEARQHGQKSNIYICMDNTCSLPLSDVAAAIAYLQNE